MFLPESPFHAVLSELPPPDSTNPTATTTFQAQSAVHDSLPIIEEIVSIYARKESATIEREIAARRKRLAASGPEEVKREVWREFLGPSKVLSFSGSCKEGTQRRQASSIVSRNPQPPKHLR